MATVMFSHRDIINTLFNVDWINLSKTTNIKAKIITE